MPVGTIDVVDDAVEHSSVGLAVPQAGIAEQNRPFHITFHVGRVIKTLLIIVALLFVTGSAANLVSDYVAPSREHKLAKLMNRFDLTAELSIPNWYSSCALLSAATLLAVIALYKHSQRDHWFFHWAALSAIFVGLSIDETARFHEMVNTAMMWVVQGHGLLYYPWVIPAITFAGLVGLSYLPFLLHVERRTAILFVAAGAIYVGGAVGMDAIGGALAERLGTAAIAPHITEYIEELMEDLGQLLFIYALLRYMRITIRGIQISFA
jgi:hypothetical protein